MSSATAWVVLNHSDLLMYLRDCSPFFLGTVVNTTSIICKNHFLVQKHPLSNFQRGNFPKVRLGWWPWDYDWLGDQTLWLGQTRAVSAWENAFRKILNN